MAEEAKGPPPRPESPRLVDVAWTKSAHDQDMALVVLPISTTPMWEVSNGTCGCIGDILQFERRDGDIIHRICPRGRRLCVKITARTSNGDMTDVIGRDCTCKVPSIADVMRPEPIEFETTNGEYGKRWFADKLSRYEQWTAIPERQWEDEQKKEERDKWNRVMAQTTHLMDLVSERLSALSPSPSRALSIPFRPELKMAPSRSSAASECIFMNYDLYSRPSIECHKCRHIKIRLWCDCPDGTITRGSPAVPYPSRPESAMVIKRADLEPWLPHLKLCVEIMFARYGTDEVKLIRDIIDTNETARLRALYHVFVMRTNSGDDDGSALKWKLKEMFGHDTKCWERQMYLKDCKPESELCIYCMKVQMQPCFCQLKPAAHISPWSRAAHAHASTMDLIDQQRKWKHNYRK